MTQTADSQTLADQALAREASRLAGLRITAGQIFRWRKRGLLPMTKKGRGRGKGWDYAYPPGSAAFAASIAREMPNRRTLEQAALASFAHGVPPGAASVLAKLYASQFDDMASTLAEDSRRLATRLAWKGSRRASTSSLLTDTKRQLTRPGQLFDVLKGSFDFTLGGGPEGLQEALALLRVSPSGTAELVEGAENLVDPKELQEHLKSVLDAINGATLDDFVRAREDAMRMQRASSAMLRAIGDLLAMPPRSDTEDQDVEAVQMVPFFLVIRRHLGDEAIDGFIAIMENPSLILGHVVAGFKTWADENPDDAAQLMPIGRALMRHALQP